jgi:predicted RNA-binding protein (virulence factor B family)
MDLKIGDEVHIVIERETPLGFVVLIEEEIEGLLYSNEIFTDLEIGMDGIGYVKNIREDGKIDISLKPQGYLNVIDRNVEKVLNKLKESPDGTISITDKSSPDTIRAHFKMSKKSYKKALGNLFKQKQIIITTDRIALVDKS